MTLRHASPVLLTADLRSVEQAALSGRPPAPLMERAGLAAAELARSLAGESGKPVLVLAGPGNNGGDALVVARHLKAWWYPVTVVSPAGVENYTGDAGAASRAWQQAGGTTVPSIPPGQDWSLVVDGLFGIGLRREPAGDHAILIEEVNALDAPVLALDVPSGLDADSGRVIGSAIAADHTITFIALKPGLLTLDGPDHCGNIHLADLGLEEAATAAPHGVLIGDGVLAHLLPQRPRNSHKGSYGSAGIVGGAHGMGGAVLLAARAALKCGTGRVYAGLLADDQPLLDPLQPELMLRPADGVLRLDHLTALAIGPGLGDSPDAAEYLDWALEKNLPLVLDADALNLVAAFPELGKRLKQRSAPSILTPHPAEAARLLGLTTETVQGDRVTAVLNIAREYQAGVVLKGCGSLCAWPDGHWAINTSGNPGMAAAGMGDVLTGIIVALLAQGVDERHALSGAVYLHGAAADRLLRTGTGPIGLTASEVIDAARRLLNRN
ncbi:MAG: NAD(P)H-hydrate dehydratase [Burkholderiales bacterium]|nr:NAD(P)H-hydrate dehydratase [Burkholderiales bacterium]MDP2398057.1 NAD(P)H-hydrate dehydratase [Burkholderiales bacterium]